MCQNFLFETSGVLLYECAIFIFSLLTIANNAPMSIGIQYLLWDLMSLRCDPTNAIAESPHSSVLFGGTIILFSLSASPFSNPTIMREDSSSFPPFPVYFCFVFTLVSLRGQLAISICIHWWSVGWAPLKELLDIYIFFGEPFTSVLSGVTTAVMKPFGRKRFIWLTLPHHIYHSRESGQELKQDRNLVAGTDAEAMEECSYWFAHTVFL